MFQGQKSNEKMEYNKKGYIYIYILLVKEIYNVWFQVILPIPVYNTCKNWDLQV